MKKQSSFKMKGFSGFGNSPLKDVEKKADKLINKTKVSGEQMVKNLERNRPAKRDIEFERTLQIAKQKRKSEAEDQKKINK